MKSYVDKLTREDIEKLLAITGYELCEYITNRKTGEPLPAIESGYDEKNENFSFFIRCTKIKSPLDKEIFNALLNNKKIASIIRFSSILNNSNYSFNTTFLIVTDFEFNEHLNLDVINKNDKEEDNQTKFVKFMAEKFGENYISDYNKFVDKYNEQLKENSFNDDDELSL
jgi:hypothetical protein